MEPECPTIDGQRKKVTLYEAMDDLDGMLFPIHQACLDLIDRMCQIHQQQDGDSTSIKPKTLMAMCKRLTNQRESNYTSSEREKKGYRYANSGGIEWSHDYYGARQFWADEWDTEPGWEVCDHDSIETGQGLLTDSIPLLAFMRRPFFVANSPPGLFFSY